MATDFSFVPRNVTATPPLQTVREATRVRMAFNVMPDKPVEETLFIREYRIWDRYIEATFDRQYVSSMEKSPSHLIFATALAHTQKLLYVYACHEFGVPYDPYGPERFKLWPTKVEVKMPQMVREEADLVHCLYLTDIKHVGDRVFKFFVKSRINNLIAIDGEVPVFRNE
jgi:hypothetical protein